MEISKFQSLISTYFKQYRKFGNTGMVVYALGFGCMRFPMEGRHVKEEFSIKMLCRAYELGVNYFDTAEGYCRQFSYRKNEKINLKAAKLTKTGKNYQKVSQ